MENMESYSKEMEARPKEDLEEGRARSLAPSVREGRAIKPNLLSHLQHLVAGSAEARGIQPVPLDERTDKRGVNLISLWFTANCSLLPLATGFSGTLLFGLSLRDASLVILFFCMLSMIPVAWMGTLGPRTGMRQMIQARYSFGLYAVVAVVICQQATLTGYTIVTAIISGQTLAAISEGHLSLTIGIVITVLVSLAVSFMGYKSLHIFENYSWIPTMVAIIITVGVGGKNLHLQAATNPPTARAVLTFASLISSFSRSWAALVSDFSVYISPAVPKTRIFSYVYFGYMLPTVPLLILGAAIGGAVPNVPSWQAAWTAYSTGGVVFAMVESVGNFGKFVAVLLALSVVGNAACSLYALSISLQTLLPIFMSVPRYVFSIAITAVVIPVAIVAASNFLESLNNFLAVIGYWTATYAGVTVADYLWFRRGDREICDSGIWNVGKRLPAGVAALTAVAISFGLIVPCMDTAWFTGPIARRTGDIGIEVGICLSPLFYVPLRTIEKRLTQR